MKWINYNDWLFFEYFKGNISRKEYYNNMSLEDKGLEELMDMLKEPSLDDDLAIRVIEAICKYKELNPGVTSNAFKGFSNITDDIDIEDNTSYKEFRKEE